jgi:hypothetical protein
MDLVLLLRSWRVHRGIKYTGEKLEYLRRIKEAGGWSWRACNDAGLQESLRRAKK